MLSAEACTDLARSGITPEAAVGAGMYSVDSARTLHKWFQDLPAMVIPYHTMSGEPALGHDGKPFFRIRYFGDDARRRYSQPAKTGVKPYYSRAVTDWQRVAQDPGIPIVITEGEKKALKACLCGLSCIGLGGVYSFLDTGGGLDWSMRDINWRGRDVYIAYDSDVTAKSSVFCAEVRLAGMLGPEYGAQTHLVRLPDARDGAKQGLDDVLAREDGVDVFLRSLETAWSPSLKDVAVSKLNQSIAWIEQDGSIYDQERGIWISKDNLLAGSRHSVESVTVMTGPKTTKPVRVASIWLTSPKARRYDRTLFKPGVDADEVTDVALGTGLNIWCGFGHDPIEGDVTPVLDLTRHIFSTLPDAVSDFPLRLIAWRAQNLPEPRPPLACVIIGPEGTGKSMWTGIMRAAFGLTGKAVAPKELGSNFNGWLERCLIATLDDLSESDVQENRTFLRTAISEDLFQVNEKFRVSTQQRIAPTILMTTNHVGAASFSRDDRRMFVSRTPSRTPVELIERVRRWMRDPMSSSYLLHWLQSVDLGGWMPPNRAPVTAEKTRCYLDTLTGIEKLTYEMRQSTDCSLVVRYLDTAMEWARGIIANSRSSDEELRHAQRIQRVVPHYPIRPWYTSDELDNMLPRMLQAFTGRKQRVQGTLCKVLRDHGLDYLDCTDDPEGAFTWHGRKAHYLVIAQVDNWLKMSQTDFEMHMAGWPNYGDVKKIHGGGQ